MVLDSRAPARTGQLRTLNEPRPIQVLIRDGRPVTLIEGARRNAVVSIEDHWVIEDEWWRRRMSRHYYRLLLEGGIVRIVYHDTVEGNWYAQGY